MATKIFTFAFLLTIVGFGCIKNEEQIFKGYSLWSKKTPVLDMKEIKATFNKDLKGSMPAEQEENVSMEEISQKRINKEQMEMNRKKGIVSLEEMIQKGSIEKQIKTNRIRREIESEENFMSSSLEPEEYSGKASKTKVKPEQNFKQAVKRQTSITGNGNRLSNLVNLPIRLNVLANVLSKLNEGVLDIKEKSSSSITISGNDNTISNLVNAPIDVDAVVNVLSNVDRTKVGAGVAGSKAGVVDTLLGGLLGGGGAVGKQDKGLVGGLLDGVLGDGNGSGLLGGLLGDTLGDLLGALLGRNGLVGNLLGGVDGKGLVTELLHNLLGGVVDLVDNLLELLVGILDGLLVGMAGNDGGSTHSAEGNHNHVSSLINAPVRVEALINALSSLKLELKQQMAPTAANNGINIKGNNNEVSSLINLPIDVNLDLNLLSSSNTTGAKASESSSSGSSLLGSLLGSSSHPPSSSVFSSSGSSSDESSLLGSLLGSSSHGSSSSGSTSHVSSLSGSSSSGSSSIGSLVGSLPPESFSSGSSLPESSLLGSLGGASTPASSSLSAAGSTNIQGNNNAISSLLNVVPDVNLNLNLLSEITDLLVGTGDSSTVQHVSNPNEICFDIPISEVGSTITGDNNKISSAINVKPKINIDLNLLSNVKETGGTNGPTQRVCITRPSKRKAPVPHRPVPPMSVQPRPTSEICFNVLVDHSGTIVSGHNNQLTSLVNLEPNINLGLNLLSNVEHTISPANFMLKRICIPGASTPQPPPIFPPIEAPLTPPSDPRCFRRTCSKWGQFVDYEYLNNPYEYPKYTITTDF